MQYCSVSVRIRGSHNHVITNKRVTVPEIRILQTIHGGDDAVTDIRPTDFDQDFNHADERQRLRQLYEQGSGNGDDTSKGLVARLFGAHGRLPTTLREIGFDPKQLAAAKRAAAEAALLEADKLEQSEDDSELNDFEQEAMDIQAARENDEDEVEEDEAPAPVEEPEAAPAARQAAKRISRAAAQEADGLM